MTVSYFFTGSPSGTEGTTEDDVAEEDGEGLSEGNEETAEDGTFSLLHEHTESMRVSISTIDNIFFISNKIEHLRKGNALYFFLDHSGIKQSLNTLYPTISISQSNRDP